MKAYKDKKEEEEKKAKVNSYFDNEISRNRFTENEVNELKIFVEKNDLDGLKNAETNLIVKRHKDSLASSADLEVNSFINKTSEKKKKTLAADDFWN